LYLIPLIVRAIVKKKVTTNVQEESPVSSLLASDIGEKNQLQFENFTNEKKEVKKSVTFLLKV